MKKLIALFCIFAISNLFSQDLEEVKNKINDQLDIIEYILCEYDLSGTDYDVNFEYHVGFLNGRAQAYRECLNLINSSILD